MAVRANKTKTKRSFKQVPNVKTVKKPETLVEVFKRINKNTSFYTNLFMPGMFIAVRNDDVLPPWWLKIDKAELGQIVKTQVFEQQKEKLFKVAELI